MNRLNSATAIQRQYYSDTAGRYNSMHGKEGIDDPAIRNIVVALLGSLRIGSLLDIGSATGRGLCDVALALPGTQVCAVEPVAAFVEEAVAGGVTRTVRIIRASGDALPFANGSFDAVSEFGVLHHVPDASAVVGEMLRVARRAVAIADSNHFGQGVLPARLFKLFLSKCGLWEAFDYVRTRGKRYQITEGDGVFFSYSVYDSYEQVARWADRILLLPSGSGHAHSWFHPLLTAPGVILIAIREPKE